MTKKEIEEVLKKTHKARAFFKYSADDYIAARTCFLMNQPSRGYILAQQAIEKQLKGIILLFEPNQNVEKNRHNVSKLFGEVIKLSDWDLEKFNSFIIKLNDYYPVGRYPQKNPRKSGLRESWTLSSGDVHLLDDLYFHLCVLSPIPDPIKFRTGIFAYICDSNFTKLHGFKLASQNNKAFKLEEKNFKKKYKEAMEHFVE